MKFLQRLPAWLYVAAFFGLFAADMVFNRAHAVVQPQSSPGKFHCAAVNVLNSAPTTVIAGTSDHNAWVIQNIGPNAIYCNGDATVTVSTTNSIQVPANGGVLTSDMMGRTGTLANETITCLAATADQSSPNNTRKCEVF